MNDHTLFASMYPIAELIRGRRTVRQFTAEPIPGNLLMELLEIACWAPNHGLREPWRFIVYRGEARREFAESVIETFDTEAKANYAKDRYAYYMEIPAHILVIMQVDAREKQREEDYAAVCCWIQNFQLAAWERNLGVVWKTNPYIVDLSFRESVGVRDDEKIVGVLHVGYPKTIPEARPRTPIGQRLIIRE